MAEATQAADDVYRMPFEVSETGGADAEKGLFDALGSDPEFQEETPDDPNEPGPGDDDEPGEPSDDPEEDPDEEPDEPDDEPEEPDEEPDEQPSYKVKVDGKEVEVPLDELLAGYSRQSDYTRKTQELATHRKTVDAEVQGYREAREQYAAGLDTLGKALTEIQPAEPDWDALRKENPAEFAAAWAEHQRLAEARKKVAEEQERIGHERAADQQKQLQALLAEERAKLEQAMPEWRDAEKREQAKAALSTYAKTTYGFTDDDLGSVYDHRIMLILDKARRFDELTTKGKAKVAEAKKTAKVLKPGARVATPGKGKKKRFRAMRENLARSGSDRHAAAAIEQLLDD